MSNLHQAQSNKDTSIAPTLEELTTRECTLPELQAAIVHLIKLHNEMNDALKNMASKRQIMSSRDAAMNTPYGL